MNGVNEVFLSDNDGPNSELAEHGERFYRAIFDACEIDSPISDAKMMEAFDSLSNEQLAAVALCLQVLNVTISTMAQGIVECLSGDVRIKGRARLMELIESVKLPGMPQ